MMVDRKSIRNPFSSDVVASPEQSNVTDVPQIHKKEFVVCCSAYERVTTSLQSYSVLLHGEAGCGKTHLLSRFRKYLAGSKATAPSIAPALFVAIRMDTAPSQVWRHLRRRFGEELTARSSEGTCPLDAILRHFAVSHGGSLSDSFDNTQIKDLDLSLIRVLEHFAAGRHRRLCRAWLTGDGLSDADLQNLELPQITLDEVEEDYAESNARRMVLAVTRLCAPSPVVFCFDQLEALNISLQEKCFAAFDRMGASLVDDTPNSLVISAVLATFLEKLKDHSPTDFVRISKQEVDLHPLDWIQTKALVDARLGVVPQLKGEDPIPQAGLRAFFDTQHGSCNPRRLIHHARQLFEQWQESGDAAGISKPAGSTPNDSISDFLRRELERLWAESVINNKDADKVLAHGLPVALQLMGHNTEEAGGRLIVGKGDARTQIVLANQKDGRSFAGAIRRLLRQPGASARLCVLRDVRLPIPPKAIATRMHLQQMEREGGQFIRVESEALAALDAMRQLVTEATSGDLSANGETIEAKTVREWLMHNLPQQVQTLAAGLLNREVPPHEDASPDLLLELMAAHKIISVDEAARLTSWPREKIEEYARKHPLHLRWFGGPCPVVCQAVVAGSEKEFHHEE